MSNLDFSAIKIKIASPEDILKWSRGEVTKPETINYRTQRPEKEGLFSESIFGPTKDWECYCGKYRRIRYKEVVCDKCGVEVTRSIVRRERMGHIKLAAPVAHIWFLRSAPSLISLLIDVSALKLEKVIYYAAFIVISVDEANKKKALDALEKEYKTRKKEEKKSEREEALKTAMAETKSALESLAPGKILSESEYHSLSRRFADVFEAGTGAGAARKLLEGIDLEKLVLSVEKGLRDFKDATKQRRAFKRLKTARMMIKAGIRPEWMIMTVLPILPPDLRPMVALDGGRYATSDLNDLYRRVINRNNRLKKLLELKAPEVIVSNEKRMLQESVDALIDNSARFGVQQLNTQRRPLRSLADMLKGKQGRFRQNLLGKRVDYSGRSVIVVGPNLKLDECGLPKKMALEIFKPFVIGKIIKKEMAHSIKNANRLIEAATPEIWEILEEVIADRKVLLNRAPTLHRLGIQAFKPVLIEDLAIRIPPMVCSAFNADFDGDQMAVHLPLTEEAQKEATEIMLSSVNLLKPATGDSVASPTQDIVLGCYYLTKIKDGAKGEGKIFGSAREALMACDFEVVDVNSRIKIFDPKSKERKMIETSCGRIIFNDAFPENFEFVNECLNKKALSKITARLIHKYGNDIAVNFLNKVKELGFEYATESGVTWGMGDLTTPEEKSDILARAEKEVAAVYEQFEQGLLTDHERRARVISIWIRAKSEIAKVIPTTLNPYGSVYSIIDSGARGSWLQPTHMMGMKGLVQNPKGETIELPVKSSFKEGFSVLEFFISTHGARKGSTDTALKTASAGYLTRRLVDVAQDVVIHEKDCRTKEGVEVLKADGAEYNRSFADRLFSRVVSEDVKSGNKIIVKSGGVVDRQIADLINNAGIESVKVFSPITCKSLRGCCSKCYGLDLGSNLPVAAGTAVGVIAAQSIGEPGTQLTMRTFHSGGVAGADITHGLPRVEELFEVRPPKGKAALAEADGVIDGVEEKGLLKALKLKILNKTKKAKILEYLIPHQATILVKPGDAVSRGDQLCEGHVDLKELFAFKGSEAVIRYLIGEVQRIYVSEGAAINDKHIEVIIRQMLSRVMIKDAGDTNFVIGDVVEKSAFLRINREMKKTGKQPARSEQLLLGITRVALTTESFLSSASFQETSRVLVNAAAEGAEDYLRGLKENVIIGRLIPAGTGYKKESEKSGDDEKESGEEPAL